MHYRRTVKALLLYTDIMPIIPLQNPERFSDPLGDHMQAATAAQAQRLGKYPQVKEVYQGFYLRFTPLSARGKNYIGGAEGIIGTRLILKNDEEGLGFETRDGQCIAYLQEQDAARMQALLEQGWTLRCTLAFSLYSSADQSFAGEAACFCYSPELGNTTKDALESFIEGISHRIGAGTHPELALTQEQFVKVVESNGAWFLTKELPYPSLPKGTVYYRRRKSINDHLIAKALDGNKGCVIASWIGVAIITLAALWLIWLFVIPLFL